MTHFHILVVCLGNICRSPLTERLMRHRLALFGHGASVAVASAGVEAPSGATMDSLAAAELTRLGGDPTGFSSRRLTAEMVGAADLVLTATRDLRARTVALHPRALKRAFTLHEFAALCEQNLATAPDRLLSDVILVAAQRRQTVAHMDLDLVDPIGCPRDVHREVGDRIDRDVTFILERLSPLLVSPLADDLDPTIRELV